MNKYWILTISVGVILLLVICYNHNTVEIPSNIDLKRIIIGTTTVDEFDKIVGSTGRAHTCMGSEIYLYLPKKSIFQSREIEIVGKYHGVNSGYHRSGITVKAYDGNSMIQSLKIEILPTYNTESNNLLERYLAKCLDWEYHLYK